ncbi:natterin-3-like [Haemaphysalis longicornis]
MAGFGPVQPMGQWVTCCGASIPPNAVSGGCDNGETVFVGRATHSGDILPGKVLRSHRTCYVSYAGVEHGHASYQVLVSNGAEFEWIPASGGCVPSGAVQGGKTKTGERLFIGRTFHAGTLTIGKVHPSHKCLYIPYGGKEHRYEKYEVLVCKTVNF